MVTLTLRPYRIARSLVAVVLLLAVLSVVGQVMRYRATNESVREIALLFKLSAEQTIPAYFSAILLLAAGVLLLTIGGATRQQGRPFACHWAVLGVIFAYLSVDEAVGIHELAMAPMQRVLGSHAVGFLYYAWVLPAAGLLCILGLVYLRFLLHLPSTVRNRVIGAAVLFVGGAVGVEMVGGYLASTVSTSSVQYALSALIEETMEMLGAVLFIYALLIYLSEEIETIGVSLGSPSSAALPTVAEASKRPVARESAIPV